MNTLQPPMATLRPRLPGRPPGVLVVAGDFFDDAGADAIVDPLRRIPGRLAPLRVTQPGAADPTPAGDHELAACETDAAADTLPQLGRLFPGGVLGL